MSKSFIYNIFLTGRDRIKMTYLASHKLNHPREEDCSSQTTWQTTIICVLFHLRFILLCYIYKKNIHRRFL